MYPARHFRVALGQPWQPSRGSCISPGEKRPPGLQAAGFLSQKDGVWGLNTWRQTDPSGCGKGEGGQSRSGTRSFVPSSFSIITLVSALLPTSSAAGAENMGFRWSSGKWSWAASRGVGLGELQRQLGGKRNHCRHTCLGHLFLCGPGSHQAGTSCITPIISTLWL